MDFDRVFFKYKPEAQEYALSDVSLSIKAGQTVGVLGGTGSAKTTLVQLIPRLYDAPGEPCGWAAGMSVTTTCGLCGTRWESYCKNVLFSGTIRENLLWGNPEADDDTLWEACRKARADEFIERLPKGMDTDLGQGGVNVSGGQKQRLCIARTLLKKPKVLIFDDSTSAVDTATEGEIREALAKLTDVTKIIIAQRITSVMDTDQIIILDDGRIHGTGTHRGAAGKGFYLSGNLCFPDERRGGLMAKRQITGKKPKNFRYTVETLLSYLGRHKLLLLWVAVLVTVSALANLLGTYMIRPVVNSLSSGDMGTLIAGVAVTGVIYAVGVAAPTAIPKLW